MRSVVQVYPGPPFICGAVAQLGERLVCNQEATGSIPVSSTKIQGGCMKKRDDRLYWHGFLIRNSPASVLGVWSFIAGVIVLTSLGLSTGWSFLAAAFFGVAAAGTFKLFRKGKS